MEGVQRKLHQRVAAWNAVLDEQDYQIKHGVSIPDRIAYLYQVSNFESVQLARRMAQRDAQNDVPQQNPPKKRSRSNDNNNNNATYNSFQTNGVRCGTYH